MIASKNGIDNKTIHFSPSLLAECDNLVVEKLFVSRSEAIRVAFWKGLGSTTVFPGKLDNETLERKSIRIPDSIFDYCEKTSKIIGISIAEFFRNCTASGLTLLNKEIKCFIKDICPECGSKMIDHRTHKFCYKCHHVVMR